ncbi:hypothetical protein HIM_01128 [Hirsutella minnesotensis 3608]|nr:hypothetical protein HIM_01128 [Hirsutella minnesotensis 3608]
MSSVTHNAGSEALVTLKISYDGTTRRAKMPLREMLPIVFEKHVRAFLRIPEDGRIMIERYSDSAAAYVMLDSSNVSVYKQLYRAAKAKSKLKLRVSLLFPEAKTTPQPAPASVEDLAESAKEHVEQANTAKSEEKTCMGSTPIETSSMNLAIRGTAPTAQVATCRESIQSSLEFETRLNNIKKTTETMAGLADSLGRQFRASAADVSNKSKPAVSSRPLPACPATGCGFAVCCNHCEKNIPGAHYHCSTCDDGDFDLCQSCVDQNITCYSNDHWLIKRTMKNGQIINSTTETIAPKPKPKSKDPNTKDPSKNTFVPRNNGTLFELPTAPCVPEGNKQSITWTAEDAAGTRWTCLSNMRTCNCCVQELPEREFLHCTTCEDFDLCQSCFARDGHGHHPKHGFVPAVAGAQMPDHIKAKMNPGRNQMHHAICDGCDKYITGVRHKCLDCPDWDYCSDCIPNAHFVHAGHRFAPIYEPIYNHDAWSAAHPIHVGICCDGPLCSISQAYPSYIRGIRYKCAVCHDLDFCAGCEASPANNHNKTHPLIKFKTPVRHVSVTTTGEHQDGKRMPAMGDRSHPSSPSDKNSINAVQTVVDVKPMDLPARTESEPAVTDEKAKVESEQEKPKASAAADPEEEDDLRAVFVRDSVQDGTILPPNHVFEQTWTLRNEGQTAWPAGCSVKFVGGDYMGHVDSAHPAGISELVSASESTVCYVPLAPGQDFSFTVLLRTPTRPGRIISYWRLTTHDGLKFGHRLWCEVNVRPLATESKPIPDVVHIEDVKKEEHDVSRCSSTMIFPKLEKESPSASIHEDTRVQTHVAAPEKLGSEDGFEECGEDDEWDASDDGFMTDEEYDILDASDEEFLEQQKKVSKK